MAAAAALTAFLLPRVCSFTSTFRRTAGAQTPFGHPNGVPATMSSKRTPSRIRASRSQRDTDGPALLPKEDLNYLVKLLAGSGVGAAVIKYGSVVFPEITRPNITQALLTIFIPVVVAVLILITESRSQ